MLTQLESRLPVGDQWRYELKLDGFRAYCGDALMGSSATESEWPRPRPRVSRARSSSPHAPTETLLPHKRGDGDHGVMRVGSREQTQRPFEPAARSNPPPRAAWAV